MAYGCEYGHWYGESDCLPDNAQGETLGAAPDTVFYGRTDFQSMSELASDLSQKDTDLTADFTWVYDSAAARSALYGNRTIEFVIACNLQSDDGTIFSRGNLRVVADGAGNLDFYVNGSSIITMAEPTTGSTTYLVGIATEPNPLTTGASDAHRTEFHILDTVGGSYDVTVVEHAIQASSSSIMVWGADDSGGTNTFTGDIQRARLSSAFHSFTETLEVFHTASAPPSLDGEARLEQPVPDVASGVGDDGAFGGPVYAMAAANVLQKDLVLVGPLVNDVFSIRTTHDSDRTSSGKPFTQEDPDDSGMYLYMQYLRRRPVPPSVNKASVRVHLTTYHSGGGDAHTIRVRCYAMNRPGHVTQFGNSPNQLHKPYVQTSVTRSNSSTGVRLDLGKLPLPRDLDGYTYIVLAFENLGGGTGALNQQKWEVNEWCVDPILSIDDQGPAFGGVGG